MDSEADDFFSSPAMDAPAGQSPLQFVEGELRQPKISALYRLSLLVVSLAMILLPIIYFAIVLLFGFGVYYYATHFHTVLDGPVYGPRGMLLKLFLYLGPLLIGTILIFFLIKPIFAPKREEHEPFSLNHADAPQLFALIGWICRSLNAPIPSRIDVDLSVNAGAGFRGGIKSMFGNDIILVIGLPLVAGLNLSQFAGVIAHEYGHFSQGAGMRAGYLIRQINGWFYRVVYERDKWDYALVALSRHEDQSWLTMLTLYLARLGVWFGRCVLGLLMFAGHALSSFLARQMEFDADLYEINMSGTQNFITTFRRLQQLNLGAAVAEKQLIEQWKKERKLFDQIPGLVAACANEIPAEIQGKVHAAASRHKTRLFDSHPSDAERIKRAMAANDPGIFHPTAAATSLFTDFGELSRRATLAHYRNLIGPGFTNEMLRSTEAAARRVEHDYAADQQNIERFFLGVATSLRPTIIRENKAMSVRRPEALAASIQDSRRKMEELLPAAQAAMVQLQGADESVLKTCQAAHLLQAGFQFDPADFHLTDNDIDCARTEATQALQSAGAQLQPFEDAGRTRLTDALQLLGLSQASHAIPEAQRLREEARQMVWVLSRMDVVFEPLLELRKDCAALEMLLHYHRTQPSADNLTATLENLCAGIQEHINLIQEQTGQLRYPFPHASGQIFVSDYARNREFDPDPFQLALREGKSHLEKITDLYHRLLGHLVLICEYVEHHSVQ